MHLFFKFVGFALLAALSAAAAMFRDFVRFGEDAADDGPRAVMAQFTGIWAGCLLLFWSFTVSDKLAIWTLRGIAAAAALLGFALSTWFAGKSEVPETPDREPTGFKNNSTDLHLE